MEKRGYKLQEFVAHSSNVNCLSIGKKTGSLFVTGGEDHKVNLWTIGKSSSLLSLSGHTSSVETVTFDSTEGLILSGASTGAIKLWDLDEGKITRSLTGHRLNCTAVEFHPFGEFFASGSSDANLKLWDIRKKGCLHTYKGHTEGINAIKFTPDGRWVVSGGADNVVKIWDLTAGKLLHEFKFHVGDIRCIDFHPMEFLLATGSADRTVKFWDLETFELIGSAGPEATGINSMTFQPDGRTLFCGLDDCLKIFSWEPIKCHDAVDMGWSTLGDLSIRDDKLLACAYDRNCVQVWVSDITKLENKTKPTTKSRPDLHECGTTDIRNIYVDTGDVGKIPTERVNSVDSPKVVRRLDTFELFNPSTTKTTPKSGPHERTMSNITSRSFTPPTPKSDRHERTTSNITSRPFTPPTPKSDRHERTISNITSRPFTPPAIVSKSTAKTLVNSKRESVSNTNSSAGTRLEPSHMRRSSSFGTFNTSNLKENFGSERHERATRPFTPPVTVCRSNADSTINSRRESIITERSSPGMKRETSHASRLSHSKSETKLSIATESGTFSSKRGPDSPEEPKFHFSFLTINEPTRINEEDNHFESDTEKFGKTPSPDKPLSSSCENGMEVQNCSGVESSVKLVSGVLAVEPGRTRSLVQRWERREICHDREAPSTNAVCDMIRETNRLPATVELKDQPPISEIEETGHITRERDGPGHVEASGHMIREKEAINHIIRERAASCHTKTEREASGHIKNERETVKHTEKEQDISRLTRKQREISNLTEKEKEVTELLGKESQRTRFAEKERDISNIVTREREASRLREKKREEPRLMKIKREPSGLIEIEEETSGLFESEMEVSRLIGSGIEAEQLTKIGYTSDGSEKEREASGTNDQDIIKALMQNHDTFLSGLRSRLTKLQVVKHFWLRNDIKGGINAVGKMPDHCVQADVATVVVEKTEMVTLDLFTCLLPLFMGLLNSDIDRHTSVSLEMLLKLVAIFGPVIRSAISASPSVRIDLQADRRREICNQCFVQLQKIKLLLPSVIRRGGSLAKGAQELNLVLQEL